LLSEKRRKRQFHDVQSLLTHIFSRKKTFHLTELKIIGKFFLSSSSRLGPRELNLSVDQWITDTLPPSNTSTSNALLLSQQQQQQSHQSKIMNVVVPNVACPPAAPKKIRRKPENKVSSATDREIYQPCDICQGGQS
jgi:hypothetical protein